MANIAGETASASVVPAISQPRTGCSGLTWNGQAWGAAVGRRRPRPDAQVLNSEKQRQDAAQRRTAEEHPPIGGCQPEQPAFAHHATDHRCARCVTDGSIASAGENGCSAKATARLKRRAGRRNTKDSGEGLGSLYGSVAFLPHAQAQLARPTGIEPVFPP